MTLPQSLIEAVERELPCYSQEWCHDRDGYRCGECATRNNILALLRAERERVVELDVAWAACAEYAKHCEFHGPRLTAARAALELA